jgi:MSHA pilin protein MshC
MRSARGFTLPELVAVMLIAAVLAIGATSLFDRRSFDAAGFADEVRAQLAYGQKVAVAARRSVTATVASNTVALTMCADAACGSTVALASPKGESTYTRAAPSGVSVGPDATFSFDALGAPSTGVALTVSGGGTSRVITVEAGTGYVH